MNEFIDLAERIEKFEEDRRVLDAAVAILLGLVPPWVSEQTWPGEWKGGRDTWSAPSFTTSVDAVLAIVPEAYGRGLILETKVEVNGKDDQCRASLTMVGSKRWEDDKTISLAPTVARALLAAVLKAHANKEN